MAYRVTFIPGDGVGPELSEATRRVLEATGVEFDWDDQEAGADVMDKYGTPLPEQVMQRHRHQIGHRARQHHPHRCRRHQLQVDHLGCGHQVRDGSRVDDHPRTLPGRKCLGSHGAHLRTEVRR